MLSIAASSTIFWVFSMTQPGIEPWSPWPLANTLLISVIYWPSTKPSIKRCTWVNKRRNSRSRCAWDNDITRCHRRLGSVPVGVGVSWCQRESQWQTEGFGPSVTHRWATPAKMRKKCCYSQKNFGSICSSLSRLQLTSHTQPTSPFQE